MKRVWYSVVLANDPYRIVLVSRTPAPNTDQVLKQTYLLPDTDNHSQRQLIERLRPAEGNGSIFESVHKLHKPCTSSIAEIRLSFSASAARSAAVVSSSCSLVAASSAACSLARCS